MSRQRKIFIGIGIIILTPIIILFIALGMGFASAAVRDWWDGDGLKCPQDYKDLDEKKIAFDIFTNDFFDKHPDASMEDFSNARVEFYKKHNCTEALQRHADAVAGNISEENSDMIDGAVRDAYHPVPFAEYMARTDKYETDKTIMVLPQAGDRSTDLVDGIVIAARENDPADSAMDWLKSEYSGYDFSYGYKERKIGGVKAYLLHWENPRQVDGALFLSPDGKQRITVSILSDTVSASLEGDFQKILDTFIFK